MCIGGFEEAIFYDPFCFIMNLLAHIMYIGPQYSLGLAHSMDHFSLAQLRPSFNQLRYTSDLTPIILYIH